MGFCDCFLNSSSFVAAAGVSFVATCVPSAATGLSCETSRVDKVRRSTSIAAKRIMVINRSLVRATRLEPECSVSLHAPSLNLTHRPERNVAAAGVAAGSGAGRSTTSYPLPVTESIKEYSEVVAQIYKMLRLGPPKQTFATICGTLIFPRRVPSGW
jgi:hypothetical protein